MGRRKKKKAGEPAAEAPRREAPFRSRPFAEALQALKGQAQPSGEARKSAPPPPPSPAASPPAADGPASLNEDDRDALGMAMIGVVPLADRGPRRVVGAGRVDSRTAGAAAQAEDAEARARARLDALVASGVTFQLERNDEYVRGARTGLDPGVLRRLGHRRGADDTLDLHGLQQPEARRELTRFVRDAHRRGLELVCIVHGKGLHSDGGLGVLRELVLETLTASGCAPCVRAFCTAPVSLGGTGALMVELQRR